MNSKKRNLLQVIPAIALSLVAAVGLFFLNFSQPVYWALIGGSLGCSLGAIIGFNTGMTAREEIIKELHGDDWHRDLIRGKVLRVRMEEAGETERN